MTRRCSSSKAAAHTSCIARCSCWAAAYIQQGANVVRDLRASDLGRSWRPPDLRDADKAYEHKGTPADVVSSPDARDHPRNMLMKAPDATRILDNLFFVNASPDEMVKLVLNVS
jgi:hypothetical protein